MSTTWRRCSRSGDATPLPWRAPSPTETQGPNLLNRAGVARCTSLSSLFSPPTAPVLCPESGHFPLTALRPHLPARGRSGIRPSRRAACQRVAPWCAVTGHRPRTVRRRSGLRSRGSDAGAHSQADSPSQGHVTHRFLIVTSEPHGALASCNARESLHPLTCLAPRSGKIHLMPDSKSLRSLSWALHSPST